MSNGRERFGRLFPLGVTDQEFETIEGAGITRTFDGSDRPLTKTYSLPDGVTRKDVYRVTYTYTASGSGLEPTTSIGEVLT